MMGKGIRNLSANSKITSYNITLDTQTNHEVGQMDNIWLFSNRGILDTKGNQVDNVPFQGPVLASAVKKDQIAVVVDWHQVWLYQDERWEKIAKTDWKIQCLCWMGNGELLVGTNEARVAVLKNNQLNFLAGFDQVPERKLWTTPWGGAPDIRSFATATDGTLYANIHVGWIAQSKDNGESWNNLKDGLEMDVHQVVVNPKDPSIVIAATASGFYYSRNTGQTFACTSQDLPHHYQRACAVFPSGKVFLTSTSRGPSGGSANLYRSLDNCQNWQQVKGLPDQIVRNINTFQIVVTGRESALVIIEDNQLYETTDLGVNWRKVETQFPHLYGAVVVQSLN